MKTPPQYCVLNEVYALAKEWAGDGDLGLQEAGDRILEIYKRHDIPSAKPTFDIEDLPPQGLPEPMRDGKACTCVDPFSNCPQHG